MATKTQDISDALFSAPGEMPALCRALDWSATPLGPVEGWSQSLRTTVGIVLGNGFPSIVLWGPELVQIYNDGYIPFLGTKHPMGLGCPSHTCWPEVRHLTEPVYERVFAGETVVNVEQLYPLLRRGPDVPPEDVYITLCFQPVRGENGGVAGVFVTLFDTTAQVHSRAAALEREGLLAAAEASRVDAERANRAKSDFLAVMSHELRTPLNAIGGYAELLELGIHGAITDAQREALGRIQRSQRHLLGLINGVLNYAKIDAGAVTYAMEDVPLAEVLGTCEALMAPQIRARALTFKYDGCDARLTARADGEKVQQVVLNLLSNAVKFTDRGGSVTLECRAEGGRVVVRVIDTGRGIAPEQIERVFQPFVQVDAELTRTREGTGLGLAISRDLARGMGGDLTAESVLGRGSTFTLTLPSA